MIWIIGDLHGDFKPIRSFSEMNLNKQTEQDTMIVLGDFGGNFDFGHHDRNFKTKLSRYHMTYFVIRGNHEQRVSICAEENPSAWHQELYFGAEVLVENEYPYIKYALDYPKIYWINDHKTLVIPGAYSVDKYHRLRNNLTWFPQEQLTEEEMDHGRHLLSIHNDIDIVLSHTCPQVFVPTDLFIGGIDQSTIDNTMERYLNEIEYSLPKYDLWCWGHYHATRVYPLNDKGQPLMLFNEKVLNLNKFYETKNIYDALESLHREVKLP